MVVRLFDFLCLLSVISHNIHTISGKRLYRANEPVKAKFFDQYDLENRRFHPSQKSYSNNEVFKQRMEKLKNEFIRHKRKSKLYDGASGDRKAIQPVKNLAATKHEIGREFILVLNVGIPSRSFNSIQEKSFSDSLTGNLRNNDHPHTKCNILHNTPISKAKVQLEVYCQNGHKKDHPSFIPAPALAKSMDTPQMKPLIKKFNITAYGVKNPPELELQVYQEMWFPVAIVAGISMLLIVLAVACLLICRKRVETADEEEQSPKQGDEKLIYPNVHPVQTMPASMIQPGSDQVYTISGIPMKPRKFKGSQKSLLDRRGSTASLVLDLTSSSTDLRSPTSLSIKESPVEEKLQSKSNPCTFDQLEECVHNTKQLYGEFWEIPMNQPLPEERIPGSSYRNRYPFILPNSRTRVILPEIPDDPLSTYINANVVRGYNGEPNAFIATQGPLSCTINDFWRMIWYHHCPIIVMITKLKERNETKCERYWPDPTFRMQEKYGDVVVTFDSALGRDGYQITSLYISHSQSLEAPRRVYHYWYTAWPDHGVPESPRQLLQLVDEVHLAQQREGGKSGPAVVHCSAGIGRTGCFAATSIGIKQIQTENCIDILKIVCLMRIDRGGMVETDSQYEFVYRTLHHHWSLLRSGGREQNDTVLEALFEDK